VAGGLLLLALLMLSPLVLLVAGGAAWVIGRQRRRIRDLEAEARQDLLTGLPNRRGLKAHWDAMPGPAALLLIDLVGFKAVNDSYGYIVGDTLLRQVAGRLGQAVAPPGLVARWGGDEFVGVVPADTLAAHRERIAALGARPYDLSARGGPAAVLVGARVGIAEGETELEQAVAVAARNLLEVRAAA
jgi:diguanylate cyclase (GGDEF)-like protein